MNSQLPPSHRDFEKRAPGLWRLVLLAALLAGVVVLGRVSGLSESFSLQSLRAAMEQAGLWGAMLFVVVFFVGELLQIPGLVFVAAAVAVYGKLSGGLLSLLGGMVSMGGSFLLVRAVGGKALADVRNRVVRKMLDRLDRSPIRTVFVLRVIFSLAPYLNYVLALSRISFRNYLIGSALGIIPPLIVAVIFIDEAVAYFLGGV